MKEDKIRIIEKKIGYTFRDRILPEKAFRHSSYVHENGMTHLDCYERLEFLGDAVLELCASRYLYQNFPEEPEGSLTRRRAALVCEPALAEKAADLGLGECLELGKGEIKSSGHKKPSILCDVIEALIGAVYLDGGLKAAENFVFRYVLSDPAEEAVFKDHKTLLQERLQMGGSLQRVEYRTKAVSDAEPDEAFFSEAWFDGKKLGQGTGRSKKNAEQQAAGEALKRLH
ncbi:MAG: ribonuclease III [Eubacterium sp.]|nr:ribonuclease III [Eubacterium sp.]